MQDASIGAQLVELRGEAEALQRKRQQATDTLRRIDSSKHQRLMVRRGWGGPDCWRRSRACASLLVFLLHAPLTNKLVP